VKGRILVVDDERSIRDVLAQVLGYEGYEVITAGSGGEAITAHRAQPFHLIILDVKMQGIDGIDTLQQLRAEDPSVRVVMISGHGTISTAVQAVKQGAFDFLEKPLDSDRLLVTIQHALDHRRLVGENARLREGLQRANESRYAMIGKSKVLEDIRELVARVAPTNARVLISGENGSGKELVAHAIHEGSDRRHEAFVDVNCAAIPSELVESELFGHVRGSFTGATADQAGKFEAADGGTLFLDEIGDLALNAQAKILRVLQEGIVVRVGGAKPITVDVRVISATNRDLSEEIAEGRFREDLFFRLNVMPIRVPPLRDRIDDIPALVAHFISALSLGPGMVPKRFSSAAIRRLQRRSWPGNVRELRNAVERILILSSSPEVTDVDVGRALPPESTAMVEAKQATASSERTLDDFRGAGERAFLIARLVEHRWNITETAKALRVPRSNLYALLDRYEIERDNPG
jgi:two-component system nitrogen regulation response regulator NtrX